MTLTPKSELAGTAPAQMGAMEGFFVKTHEVPTPPDPGAGLPNQEKVLSGHAAEQRLSSPPRAMQTTLSGKAGNLWRIRGR